MKRVEAYFILNEMWKDANEKQREAIDIAQNDIEFVDLMPKEIIAKFNYGIKTNADHIRSMSDEELFEAISSNAYTGACNDFGIQIHNSCFGDCRKCEGLREWLKQPYKENA